MSARAASARHPVRRAAPKRAAAPPRPRPRVVAPRPRTRLRILLIPLIAVLLGGIVWVNVAKLSLTTRTTEVVKRSRAVEAENSRLEGKLAAQEGQIQNLARKQGMGEVQSDATTFLQGAGAPR
jgi:hypothetical protein